MVSFSCSVLFNSVRMFSVSLWLLCLLYRFAFMMGFTPYDLVKLFNWQCETTLYHTLNGHENVIKFVERNLYLETFAKVWAKKNDNSAKSISLAMTGFVSRILHKNTTCQYSEILTGKLLQIYSIHIYAYRYPDVTKIDIIISSFEKKDAKKRQFLSKSMSVNCFHLK